MALLKGHWNYREFKRIGIAPDSSFALISIQDSFSAAAVDLQSLTSGLQQGLGP